MKVNTIVKFRKETDAKDEEGKDIKEMKECEEKDATHKLLCRCEQGLPCKLVKLNGKSEPRNEIN